MQEKVVVTGGLGFIGSQIVEALVEQGYAVKVFDDCSLGFFENLEKVKGKYEFEKGDVRDFGALERAFKDAKCVFHMAALSYVGESLKFPEKYNDVNVLGTLNALRAAHSQNVPRFLFPSTCVVYGNISCPISENSVLFPNSPYAISKVAGEFYTQYYHDIFGMETVSLRIFNAYGPRMRHRAVSMLAEKLFQGQSPNVTGDGRQIRDYVFSKDIVDAFVKAMRAPKRYCGAAYNVGTGKGTSLNDLLGKMNKTLGTSIPTQYIPQAQAEVFESIADTRLAFENLGFEAKTQVDDGLRKTLSALQEDFKSGRKL
ncbi:MAG: GDP-mannose 4,6-dehydratase [Candidatus Diapherotrites archaeon]